MVKAGAGGFSRHARIRSRRSVIQAYYQWLLNEKPIIEIVAEFKLERNELKKADIPYFESLLLGMVRHRTEMDQKLAPILDRAGTELDPVEYAILQLGTYELLYLPELPSRVIINEAIELAKMFGADQSHKYINGILDKLAHICRQVEFTGH